MAFFQSVWASPQFTTFRKFSRKALSIKFSFPSIDPARAKNDNLSLVCAGVTRKMKCFPCLARLTGRIIRSNAQERGMAGSVFSRRAFSRVLRSLAGAFTAPKLPLGLDDRHAKPAPPNAIRLNFNENPYGPSPKALAALDSCGQVASRYPGSVEIELTDALAKKYKVSRENIALGC